MAINSYDTTSCEKYHTKTLPNSSKGDIAIYRSSKGNIISDDSVTGAASKRDKIKKNKETGSPYLANEKVHLVSRVSEKKCTRQIPDLFTSLPLVSNNIYKANSDDLKSVNRASKKVKKSVLTLPNEPSPMPHACTVSDMNEYVRGKNSVQKVKSSKKRFADAANKKCKNRNKNYEFYDRDARYCDLDCSSTDMIKYKGDGKKISSRSCVSHKNDYEDDFNPHDVWAVLRNINRFQFRPSPPMSGESILLSKKKKATKTKRNTKKDPRYIETCCTEEIAFISSIEVDSRTGTSLSKSSSFDRVTVIEQDPFNFNKAFENTCTQSINFEKTNAIPKNKIQIKNKSSRLLNNAKNQANKRDDQIVSVVYKNGPDFKKYEKINTDFLKLKNKNGLKDRQLTVSPVNFDKDRHIHNLSNRILPHFNERNDKFTIRSSCNLNKVCTDQYGETEDRFIHSGTSGSSKARLHLGKDHSNNELNPITNVVLSKTHGTVSPDPPIAQKRKPRLVTTMPSTVIPRLTQTEIKRRLAHIKFPLVILGKDQLRSSVEVLDYDPPQFSGLDEHIWPFMLKWTQTSSKNDEILKSHAKITKLNRAKKIPERIVNVKRGNNESVATKSVNNKDKSKRTNFDPLPNRKKMDIKPKSPSEVSYSENTRLIKSKPIKQFKDKMIKFIYKKSSSNTILDDNHRLGGQGDSKENKIHGVKKIHVNKKQVNVGTETNVKFNLIKNDLAIRQLSPPAAIWKSVNMKYPWSKAKWASDFIDNIMRKIKNGVYYNADQKHHQMIRNDSKEVSIQTTLTMKKITNSMCNSIEEDIDYRLDLTPKLIISKKDDPFKVIPGFDDTLPSLEIKSLNTNQISVKNCLTNVMVQFDVTVPLEPNQVVVNTKKPSACVPITVNNSQMKIFKCKTTIFNAMLPAELCSLLPKMMRNIIRTNDKPGSSYLPLYPSKIEPLLPIMKAQSPIVFNSIMRPLSPIPFGLLSRSSLHEDGLEKKNTNVKAIVNIEKDVFKDYSISLPLKILNYCYCMHNPLIVLHTDINSDYRHNKILMTAPALKLSSNCTSIQPYTVLNKRIVPAYTRFDIAKVLETIERSRSIICVQVKIPSYIFTVCGKPYQQVTIKFMEEDIKDYKKIVNNVVDIDCLYNVSTFSKTFNTNDAPNYKKSADLRLMNKLKSNDEVTSYIKQTAKNSKITKKTHVKLYKKCKSASNISNEKSGTLLSKIVNIDDFLQIIGSGKALSSVFDGYAGNKIMSSVLEMKSWITEISPVQALLVLLLTNKKDTPTLVRFRPLLLQGIAVNRITRATELDMEIEVIEKENFNKFSQFEGISYSAVPNENHQNLLEELYWIAKTTSQHINRRFDNLLSFLAAIKDGGSVIYVREDKKWLKASDYKIPFDESSERLLKTLLGKRKKLNPSYLRVMARYVGLGLLKSK